MKQISAELYQEVILDHNKNPKNFGEMENPTHFSAGHNPLCGDNISVYLNLSSENLIEDIKFKGQACAICKASASLMTSHVKKQSKEHAELLIHEFHLLLTGKAPVEGTHSLGRLTLFSGVWNYPARVKCAALPWHTLKGALDSVGTVTTESPS